MESASQKIITKIEAILPILQLSDSSLCAYYYNYLSGILDQLNKPHDSEKIAAKILSIYGGMATFNDIGIWKNGKILREEDDRFENLSNELYLICKEARGEQ